MLNELKKSADRNDLDLDDLRTAASHLVTRQFLYFANRRDKRSYRLVMSNKDYFRDLLDALDFDLITDDDLGMVGSLPRKRLNSLNLKKTESLFLLTLRLLYEEALVAYKVTDGCTKTDSEQLLARYSAAISSSERPNLGDLKAILAKFRQYGLIREINEENRVMDFLICPSIREVVTKDWVETMERFTQNEGICDIETGEGDADNPEDEAQGDSIEEETL